MPQPALCFLFVELLNINWKLLFIISRYCHLVFLAQQVVAKPGTPLDLDKRPNKDQINEKKKWNYFTSSDPHRDIILKHIRHKFWHSFCPSVSRFHQNYPLLLVPSPGSGSSSDHCDLSSQTDSNWLSLCLIQNNFRRPGVSAWKLRFERYKTIWLS